MFAVLLAIALLMGVLLAYRQVHDRASWVMCRVRLAHGTDRTRLEAQFLGLCRRAGGGEVWAIHEGASYALVLVVPRLWEGRLRDLVNRVAPGSHVAVVRELTFPATPCWSLVQPNSANQSVWPYGIAAGLVVTMLTKTGHAIVLAANLSDAPKTQPGRVTALPLPPALRHTALPLIRIWLLIPGVAKPLTTLLLPDPAIVSGAALPQLPDLGTTVRERHGGILRLGHAHDGAALALPLGSEQAVEIVGGAEERRPLLINTLRAVLESHVALVAFVHPSTADLLLTQAHHHRPRMRVIDHRAMATTATLDLSALSDDHLVGLLDRLMGFDLLDPARRLIRPALQHWRNDPAPRQFGRLLARLFDPPPEVSALAQYEKGGESYFDWRTYGARWQMRALPYLSRRLLGLFAAPGEQLPQLLAAGGALLVVQPDNPEHRRALHLVLETLCTALPPFERPLVLASEYDTPEERLAVASHAAIWTSTTWSSMTAWRMVAGGMLNKTLPPIVRSLVPHPLALITLKQRWFLCGPDGREYAIILPPGIQAMVKPGISTDQQIPMLPTGVQALAEPSDRGSQGDDTHAAVQTVLGALRLIGSIQGTIGAIDYVTAQQARVNPVQSIAGVVQIEHTIQVVWHTISPAMQANLPIHIANWAKAGMYAEWRTTATGIQHLAVTVRESRLPAIPIWTFGLQMVTGEMCQFLWDRLSHLLLTGKTGLQCARSLLRDTLVSASANHCALFLLGEVPPELLPFTTSPHYTPTPHTAGQPDTLETQIDALLSSHSGTDGDGRPHLVVVTLPEESQLTLIPALMRLLQRAHHRPVVVLCIAPMPGSELLPLINILPVLACSDTTCTLTNGADRRYVGCLPATIEDDALTRQVKQLAPRKHMAVVLDSPGPSTFWHVDATELAPAVGGPGMVAAETQSAHSSSEFQSAQSSESHSTFHAIRQGVDSALPPQLGVHDIRRVLLAGLADARRQITARMVCATLSEYTMNEREAWALLVDLYERVGVLKQPQQGRGAYRIDPALATAADVWIMAARSLDVDPAVFCEPPAAINEHENGMTLEMEVQHD